MLRLLSLLMAVLFVLALSGCQKPAPSAAQITKPVQTEEAAQEPTPTPEPTPEPTPSPSEVFAAFDRAVFIDYATSDGYSLHETIKDPSAFGIDAAAIPMTWGDFSEEASHRDVAECKAYLEQLRAIDRGQLTDAEQLSYDVLERYFEWNIVGDAYEYYYEPLTQYTGLQVNLPLALWLFNIETEADVRAYLDLAADTPRYFEQVLAYEQKRSENGRFMTKTALDAILADLDQIIGAGKKLFLIPEFEKSLAGVEGLTDEQRAAYLEEGKTLLTGAFLDAFKLLKEGLLALQDTCREAEGMAALGEEARAYFTLTMQQEASAEITPEDALALLESEFNYLVLTYRLLSMDPEAAEDPSIPLTSGDAMADLVDLEARCASLLPKLPEHSIETRQVPRELEALMSPAAYAIPPVDDWQENTVILNPSADQSYLFMTLAHEGYPGHLYQHVYQRNVEGLGLVQQALPFGGYVEGWAQYAEEIAIMAQTRYNRTTTMMQFCNDMALNALLLAITSIKVNYEGLNWDGLQEYLSMFGFGDAEIVDIFYDSAVNMPFYAFSYGIGYAQLADMMLRLSADLGEAYIQRDVLTRYLDYGPAYFDLLRERMDVWADEQVQNG